MPIYTLELELLSDTTPGRGEGVAGLVDAEVQHDELGLPVISGRALKGCCERVRCDSARAGANREWRVA